MSLHTSHRNICRYLDRRFRDSYETFITSTDQSIIFKLKIRTFFNNLSRPLLTNKRLAFISPKNCNEMKISIRSSPNFGKSFRREIRESTCSPTRFLHYSPEKNGEECCLHGGKNIFVETVIDFEQRFRLYDRSTRAIKPPNKG